MKILKGLVILLGTLSLNSCDIFKNEQSELLVLQGTWDWERSSGGIGGWEISSDSVDYEITLIIKGSNVSWFHNNELDHEYEIKKSKDTELGFLLSPKFQVNDQYIISKQILRINVNELIIADNCTDCYSYTFRRLD